MAKVVGQTKDQTMSDTRRKGEHGWSGTVIYGREVVMY
jgi:hypothetical protein